MRAVISVAHDPRLIDLFAAEDKDIGRARYTVTDEDEAIVFTIEADDATAMRAALNAITKLLQLWERTETI